MPEQPVLPKKDIESEQKITFHTTLKHKGDMYENNRHYGSGRIQCRN